MNWYLIQTKTNRHILAKEHLKRQGFKVFLPLILKTTRRRLKFVNDLKPLFPSYLFVGTELDDIPWKSINATRGVSKAVTLDGQYRAIDPEIIKGIALRCDSNGVFQSIDSFDVGDRVKIEKGPFADFICIVEKIADAERAWVLIDILQNRTCTRVSLNNLLKID